MSGCVRTGLVLVMLVGASPASRAAELTLMEAAEGGTPAALPVPKPMRPRTTPIATSTAVAPAPAIVAPTDALNPAPTAAQVPAGSLTSPIAKPVATIPEPVKVSNDPRPTLSPDTFVATMRAADRYRQIAEAGGWPLVPAGVTAVKLGEHGEAISVLKHRLAISGDLAVEAATGDMFDAVLLDALKRFQARHGLPDAGVLGARTIAAMNVPADIRVRQLAGSAARLMGSKFAFGERYVAVNIPAATVEAVQNGVVARRYVAIVGKPDRPSPSVETRVTNINFNPTWTVPVSLIKKDIIPHVRKDPGYLAKMKIHLLDGAGNEVDPNRIDWATEQAVNYTVRQDSGVANSLGEVRIDMPNRHAVYMHDTPSKRLFARSVRFESSGCVRVSGVRDLIAWLLEGTVAAAATPVPGGAPTLTPAQTWGPADIDAAIASGRRLDVKLPKPVPVAWVYLTGYAAPDGTVHFRDDPYGLDNPAVAPVQSAPTPSADPLVTGSIVRRP